MQKQLLAYCSIIVHSVVMMLLNLPLANVPQIATYYQVTTYKIIEMYLVFPACYLLLGKLMMWATEKRVQFVFSEAMLGIVAGSFGRWMVGNHYNFSLLFTFVVSISQVALLMTIPKLIKSLAPQEQPQAEWFFKTLPYVAISCYFFSFYLATNHFITNQTLAIEKTIHLITFLIFLILALLALPTFLLFCPIHVGIPRDEERAAFAASGVLQLWGDLLTMGKKGRYFMVLLLGWGMMEGLFLLLGGMFSLLFVFRFAQEGALIGAVGMLTPICVGLIQKFLHRMPSLLMLFFFSTLACLGCLWIQASSIFSYSLFHNLICMCFVFGILRLCFAIASSLAIHQLNKSELPPIFITMTQNWIACGTLILWMLLFFQLTIPLYLILVCFTIWLCVFTHTCLIDQFQDNSLDSIFYTKNNSQVVPEIQLDEIESGERNSILQSNDS